jgi:hypothetical protein
MAAGRLAHKVALVTGRSKFCAPIRVSGRASVPKSGVHGTGRSRHQLGHPSRLPSLPCAVDTVGLGRLGILGSSLHGGNNQITNKKPGAGSGFGRAIAKRFADEGCRVLVGDLNLDGAKETVAQMPRGSGIPLRMDVTKGADWKLAVQEASDTLGKLDILINNAGWSYKNKARDQDFVPITEQ